MLFVVVSAVGAGQAAFSPRDDDAVSLHTVGRLEAAVWGDDWHFTARNVGVFWDFENVRPTGAMARSCCATMRGLADGLGNFSEGVGFTNMAAVSSDQLGAMKEYGFDVEEQPQRKEQVRGLA